VTTGPQATAVDPQNSPLLWHPPGRRAVPSVTGMSAALLTLQQRYLVIVHSGLPAPEVAQHLRRALKHSHIRAAQRPFPGHQLQVEMRPPLIPQVQSRWRCSHPSAELHELDHIIGGGEHMRPSRGPQVFPVHHDHRRTPAFRRSPGLVTIVTGLRPDLAVQW
jgi:hypothetical protein